MCRSTLDKKAVCVGCVCQQERGGPYRVVVAAQATPPCEKSPGTRLVLLDCHSSNRTFTNASRPHGMTTIEEGGPGSCPRASCLLGTPGRHARSRGSGPAPRLPQGPGASGSVAHRAHTAAQRHSWGRKSRATVGKPTAARGRPFAGLPRRTAHRPWVVIPYKQESRSLGAPGDGRGSSPQQVQTRMMTRMGSALGSVSSSFGVICRLVLPRH